MKYFFEIQMHKVEMLVALVFILAMLLIPYAASAEWLGYRSCSRVTGNCNYYSAPNAGADNAASTRNFLNSMQLLQQSIQFNRQMELEERRHEQWMRESRAQQRASEQAHNAFMHQLRILKGHRDAGRVSQDEVDGLVRSLLTSNQSTEDKTFRLRVFNGTISTSQSRPSETAQKILR